MNDFAIDHPELDLLQSRLQSAKRRYIMRELAVAVLLACCSGSAVFLLMRVTTQFGVLLPTATIGAFAVLAFLAMIARGLLRLPSDRALAIAADQASYGEEIFRTAWETSAAQRNNDVLARRLMLQAEQLATQIVPANLVPGVSRTLIGATIVLATAVLVGAFAWPSSSFVSTPSTTIEGVELQAIVTALDEIGIRLEDEAMAEGDQYLMAISRALADISRENADQPSVTRSQLARDLEAVSSHAGTAVQGGGEGGALLDQIAQLQQRVEQGETAFPPDSISAVDRRQKPNQASTPLGSDEAPAENIPVEGGLATSTAPGANRSDIVPDDLPTGPVQGPCQIDGEESCMGPADTNYSADRSMPTGDAAQALGSTSRSEAEVAGREGMLIGAASQSGQGDSALAGQGTEDLLGPDASQSLDALRDFLTIAADRVAEGGRSMTQDQAPEQAPVPGVAGSLDAAAGQWRKLPEQPGSHGDISAVRRSVLIQYFDRPVED